MAPLADHRLANPELRDFDDQIGDLVSRVEELVRGLDDRAASWQPDPSRWSAAQCLDHLNAVCRLYLPDLEAVVAQARARGLTGAKPPRRGWLGGWVIRTMETPGKIKVKAPAPFVPAARPSLEHVAKHYRADKERLRGILAAADGLDLWRVKMRMSAFKLIKLSLGEILAFLLAHERRHLRQAEDVRSEPGFPAPQADTVAAE